MARVIRKGSEKLGLQQGSNSIWKGELEGGSLAQGTTVNKSNEALLR